MSIKYRKMSLYWQLSISENVIVLSENVIVCLLRALCSKGFSLSKKYIKALFILKE